MAQALSIQPRGLYTHPNELSEVPPGALTKAKNTVIDKEGIVEIRRGLKHYGNLLSGSIKAIFNYADMLIVNYGSSLARDSDGLGTWTNYSGTYNKPAGAVVIKALEASKNFYFTTDGGIMKLDSVTGTVVSAGVPKALDGTASLSGVTGFLSDSNQVAYRVVWGITDANNNLLLSSPSQRIIVTNSSGGTRNVSLTFTVPSGITTSHFYQVYRSVMSGGTSVVPNDELGLVYENNPSAGEITAKSVTITDTTPENLRGATLYTSPSQQGIAQSNDQPPLAQDIAFYKNSTLYANTISKQRLIVTLISVGASSGIQVDDTIAIGGVTYTGKASESAAAAQFKVDTSGTPAQNIDSTAQSIIRVINQYSGNTTYYAYYLSGYNDLPGKILIEERGLGGSSYAVTSSRGGAFNPTLPTSGTTISTSNETSKNRIYISKLSQPESVPIANYIDIGSANKNILRVIALRDSVFVFKEDGVYRITGEDITTFRVSLFDVTVALSAPESAVPFNNQIYAYTTQGVVAISDTGTAILSRPIEVDLLPLSTYLNFKSMCFAISYNSDRQYILFVPSTASDTYPTQAYVYNSLTQAWTRWVMNRSCGIINSADNKIYLGDASNNYVYLEKKSFDLTDYSDEEVAVTITGSSGTTVNLSDTTGISAGNLFKQGTVQSTVSSVDSSTALTVSDSGLLWTAGAATAYVPIPVEIETVAQTAGNPGILKHHYDVTIFFRKANFRSISVGFRSDISTYLETYAVTPAADYTWGRFSWGNVPWGGLSPDLQPIRTYVPRNKQRGHWLVLNVRHQIANNYFAIGGMSMQYNPMSSRVH